MSPDIRYTLYFPIILALSLTKLQILSILFTFFFSTSMLVFLIQNHWVTTNQPTMDSQFNSKKKNVLSYGTSSWPDYCHALDMLL